MMQEFIAEMESLINDSIQEIHTAMPGRIESIDYENGTADVQPVMKKYLRNEEIIDYPLITNVPIVFPQGNGQDSFIVYPVRPGDSCLLIVSEQALDYWQFGMETDMNLPFDLTNAVCIPGLFQRPPDQFREANEHGTIIMKAGDTKLKVSPEAVTIDGDLKLNGRITAFDYITEVSVDGCQIINSIGEMNTVTADRVLVLHNNSAYGDGGPCWFELMENVTENGYAREDGKRMCPMLDQGPLLTSDPPVEKMIGLMASYLENDALVYGNEHTLFDSDTTNQIDCSSFVSAVLHGISYNSSKYTTGSSTRRVARIASYSPVAGSIFGHLKSRRMAQFFAERKWLHSMPTTYQMRNVLQFGDILFSWDGTETAKNRYLEIGHVSIVLGIVNNTYVIVAQCGGYPTEEVTIKNNSNTVGKISTIALSSANISKYFRAFARIPYINEHDSTVTGNRIKPVLIPNIWVDGDRSGEISSSSVCATSYGYISVLPNSVITFTGKTAHNGNNLSAIVAEYDGKFKFLSKTNFTANPKTLSASTRYIRLCYSHPEGSNIPMLLDDCDQFEATIS